MVQYRRTAIRDIPDLAGSARVTHMDLPELTHVSEILRAEYEATRFKWQFHDGRALFEAFYSAEPLRCDAYGRYRTLAIAYKPTTNGTSSMARRRGFPNTQDGSSLRSWAHVFHVRRNGWTGMLFVKEELEQHETVALREILGINGSWHGGRAWTWMSFIQHADSSCRGVPSAWRRQLVASAVDTGIPGHGSDDDAKVYWRGWRQNPPGKHQTRQNYLKTRALLGVEIAETCRSLNVSTCWSDTPAPDSTSYAMTLMRMGRRRGRGALSD